MFGSHSAPQGVLTVTVIEARNLDREDFAGHNDSYVELWLDDDYKQRTSTVKDTENPVFNETFTFNIQEGSSEHKIYFKVIDKDTVGTDKIGEGKVDVADCFKGEPLDTWVKLPAMMGLSSKGEVHFAIQFSAN